MKRRTSSSVSQNYPRPIIRHRPRINRLLIPANRRLWIHPAACVIPGMIPVDRWSIITLIDCTRSPMITFSSSLSDEQKNQTFFLLPPSAISLVKMTVHRFAFSLAVQIRGLLFVSVYRVIYTCTYIYLFLKWCMICDWLLSFLLDDFDFACCLVSVSGGIRNVNHRSFRTLFINAGAIMNFKV